MQNKVEYFLFITFSKFFNLLGLDLSRRIAFIFTLFVYYLIPIRKKITLNNLRNAFPEYPEKKIRNIAFSSYKSFIITLIEILTLPNLNKDELEKAVDCPNKYLITEKLKLNRGVILLSAHFGNWEYIAASVSSQVNAPFYVVVKSQRNPYVNDWMNKFRTKWINKVVPLGISIRQIYKELKEKHLVAMVADQRGSADGIRVNLFNRPAAVYPGPAMLALKTGAPILYGITVRQPDYSYKAYLEEICIDNLPAGDDEKVIEISRRHTEFLEKFIRQYPEQWLWMHNRWKY